jgi:YHS domain-containing protein
MPESFESDPLRETPMRRGEMLAWSLAVSLLVGAWAVARPDEEKEIPAPFAPFEHMVGGWKGAAVPAANRIRGWPERHLWAWKFAKGVPIGMNITIEGGKILSQALLSYDPATPQYRLEGTDPAGQPVAYVGPLNPKTNALELDRVGTVPDGSKERLTIRPNSNLIRYTMNVDRQEPGAPQFGHYIEAGLTKEGESFAAGGAAADLPKCIVTGGTATLSVSYQGKTYPLCCTGCRDEFTENPAKYVQKALLRAQAGGGKPAGARPAAGKDDGSFDDLFTAPKSAARPPATRPAPTAKAETPAEPVPTTGAAPKDEPTAKDQPATKPALGVTTAKATSLLRFGQALERSGNTAGALGYYRQLVKDYPDTEWAKAAAERIKALGDQ